MNTDTTLQFVVVSDEKHQSADDVAVVRIPALVATKVASQPSSLGVLGEVENQIEGMQRNT